MHQLFDAFADRYDLHTPPQHYQHDQRLVLELAAAHGPRCRLLDVGCGTGVLVAKALDAGFDAHGLDAAQGMIAVAKQRVPEARARVQRMQDIDELSAYGLIVSLSWSIHYCADEPELCDVLQRFRRALTPGGTLLIQVAHADNLHGDWREDKEVGPQGAPEDISLRYRFTRPSPDAQELLADYDYRCLSHGEAMKETHVLRVANATRIATLASQCGFSAIEIWNSWKRDPLSTSGSVFVVGRT